MESHENETTAAPVANAPPDWDQHTEPLECPLCTYDLRYLTQSRCPECGYRFEWEELLDPARRLHPYLFEHHPEASTKCFFKTLLGGLRPLRFWQSLHPVQPSRPRRLVLYWALCSLSLLMPAIGTAFVTAQTIASQMRAARQNWETIVRRRTNARLALEMEQKYGSVEAWLDTEYPTTIPGVLVLFSKETPAELMLAIVVTPFVPAAIPWLTAAALMVFVQSMHRTKIQRAHVLRCAIYSFDMVFWISCLGVCAIGLVWMDMGSFQLLSARGIQKILKIQAVMAIVLLLIGWFRLWMAYRLYLRFPHAFAVAFSSFVIVGLFIAAIAGFILYPP